jgi:hypothetical protein
VKTLDPVEQWLWRILLWLLVGLILIQFALSFATVRQFLLPIARLEGRTLR